MKKAIKLFALGLTTVILLNLMALPCFAKQKNEVYPMWENIQAVTLDISFEGLQGNVQAVSMRKGGVNFQEGNVSVYKRNGNTWSKIASTEGSSTRNLVVNLNFDAEQHMEYKAEFTVSAYRNGVPETYTKTTYKTCP